MSACAGDGGRVRGRGRRAAARPAAADLLRRVGREPRPARVHAPRTRLPRLRERDRDGAGPSARSSSRGLQIKKAGNELIDADRRARGASRSTCGWAASTACPPGASWRRCASGCCGRASLAREAVAWTGRLDVPRLRARRRAGVAERARRVPDRPRAAGLEPRASTSRPPEFEDHVVEEHVEHSNALYSRLRERGAYLAGPMARYELNFDRLSPLAQEAAREAGLDETSPQPVPEHRRARGRDPVRVRRGDADHRRLRAARPARGRARAAGRASGTAGRRRPAACSTTATSWTTTGKIVSAKIVPPTSQNQKSIEEDLLGVVQEMIDAPRGGAAAALRAGDPQLRPLHLLRDALPAHRCRARIAARGRDRRRQRLGRRRCRRRAGARVRCASEHPDEVERRRARGRADRAARPVGRRARWRSSSTRSRARDARRGAGASTPPTRRCPPSFSRALHARVQPRRGDRAGARARPAARAAVGGRDRGAQLRGRARRPGPPWPRPSSRPPSASSRSSVGTTEPRSGPAPMSGSRLPAYAAGGPQVLRAKEVCRWR